MIKHGKENDVWPEYPDYMTVGLIRANALRQSDRIFEHRYGAWMLVTRAFTDRGGLIAVDLDDEPATLQALSDNDEPLRLRFRPDVYLMVAR